MVVVIGFEQNYLIYGQSQIHDISKDDINNFPKTIEGLQCDKVEHLVFHNHTKIIMKIQNVTQDIPGNIGIVQNNCIFWLHTHDNSGIIHVESPIRQTYTLGQFLDIWEEFDNSSFVKNLSSISSNDILNILIDDVAIDPSSIDFRKIILKDNSIISVDIGNISKN
ncbi:MAG: hypothetical protein H0X03_08605 [Nitrosopumilus sp.]|nr:hypothetical protein [Nitrosopumilus sp.]